MPHYRITRRGAQHRRREGAENKFRAYAYGDSIELTEAQVASGAYRHLGLERTTRGSNVDVDVTKHGGAHKAQDTVDAPRTAPTAGDDGGSVDPQNDLDAQKQEDAETLGQNDDQTEDQPDDETRKRLQELKTEVDAVKDKPTLDAARAKVIESGLLGDEGSVPTKKKDLLEAIEKKIGTEE